MTMNINGMLIVGGEARMRVGERVLEQNKKQECFIEENSTS